MQTSRRLVGGGGFHHNAAGSRRLRSRSSNEKQRARGVSDEDLIVDSCGGATGYYTLTTIPWFHTHTTCGRRLYYRFVPLHQCPGICSFP